MLRRFVSGGAHILLVGCGSGRDLLVLAARGYVVTGVDPAGDALDTARRRLAERQLSATLIAGFFEDVPLSGRFDAISFSSSYSYIPESRRRIEALRKAAAHLAPNGHILLTYQVSRQPHRAPVAFARVIGALTRSDWRFEPGDLVRVLNGGGRTIDYLHVFSKGGIDAEAAAAGLRVVFRGDAPHEPLVTIAALALP